MKSLDKKGITVMRINSVITGIIILLVLGIAIFYIYPEIENMIGKLAITTISVIIIVLVLIDIIIIPKIRYDRYKYLITDERVEVKKGLFLITTSIIQIKRIQKIELSNGPIDRKFGLSNVNIYTAAGTVDIKFLSNEEAREISDKVNELLKHKLEKKNEN